MITIKSKESWKEETSNYLVRIEDAVVLRAELVDILTENWLSKYFPGPEVSRASNVAILLNSYSNSLFSVVMESLRDVIELWRKGRFVLVPLIVRYVFECWGGIHYARRTLSRLISEGNVEEEENRAKKLNFGARTTISLLDGNDSTETSINVMTFIKNLKGVDNPEEEYAFLSEACHANMLQSSYFQLAGPPISNWENKQFKEHGHKLLGRVVSITESICNGVQNDLLKINISTRKYVEGNENVMGSANLK